MAVALATATAATAQSPEIPPGYTAYEIEGPGVGPPPLPFRIDGASLVAPEGGAVRVVASRLTAERAEMTIEWPGATVRFLGARQGDEFAGYAFLIDADGDRDAAPVTITPQGREPALRPEQAELSRAPGVSRIEVVPADVRLEAGERRQFVARVFDEAGRERSDATIEWYAGGSGTLMSAGGELRATTEGGKAVYALVDGALGVALVTVAAPTIDSLVLRSELPSRLAAGSRVAVDFHALDSVDRWVLEPDVEITSLDIRVVAVEGRDLIAVAPGRATLRFAAGRARLDHPIEVPAAPADDLRITGAPSTAIRTGDVVRLGASVPDAAPLWSISGEGAHVYPDGAFVAERPGRYRVVALLGDDVATVEIVARARGRTGRIRIRGHGRNVATHTSDLWPQNGYVYLGTHQANQVRTYDVSDPANPVLTDSAQVDARVINSVKVSEDGQWLAATREGAASRRNGILFYSLADPAHPRLVSEYTETVTSGVHNVFWVGDLIYATNDGTGDMHIVDLSDPANPKEIGRWGLPFIGKTLHDVWVQEGVAYLSYWGDGLVILDVGGAGKGGTPEEPVLVSRIFYPGGPTHSAHRYGDYVFVGDEDFSLGGTVPPAVGNDPRGPVHVIDVRDLERPVYAARYEVPEAGAHNFWVDAERGLLYLGGNQGGIRVVDVTGELRGELYRQGREVAHFLPAAGPEAAVMPFLTRVWGVYPMFSNGWRPTGEVLYATDYNSGLWSFTVELQEEPIS